MADGNLTTTLPTTPATGGLNFEDYQKKIETAAAQTREVTTNPYAPAQAGRVGRTLQGERRSQAAGAISNYKQQLLTKEKEAEKAATGLEMVGDYTGKYMENLEAIQSSLSTQIESSQDSWGAAAEKADEYVTAARGRVSEVLGKIDEINKQIAKDRDFSKSHAMQASVQATLGSMKAEERNILETYGADSKEFQQFVGSKQTALATIQSNIHATYQQLSEQQGQNYLNATMDAMTKSNMYLGFQEQQHVEMLKFKEASKNAYNLQVAQFEVGIEQMKMAGMENLANWIIETPTFSMDSTPLMTLIGDMVQTQRAEAAAYDAANPSQAGPNIPASSHLNTQAYNRAQGSIKRSEGAARSSALGY